MNDTRPPKPELLAPAGEPIALRAALDAGADAVYFGAGGFNMRKRARNFSIEDIGDVVASCRASGAKAYLAVNTIVYESELANLDRSLDAASEAGVDAIICWDGAVMEAAAARGIDVHLSTQASVSNSREILRHYRRNGIRRFVLARECTLDHITAIRSALEAELGAEADGIELEAFIHGAMCVSVSGRCFMSEYTVGESANRGACLQPCRREYRIIDVEGEYEYEIGRDFVMSPRDLCTMPFLDKVLDAGIASLKIEGRMRNPEYAATVVSSYRQAVNFWHEHLSDSASSDIAARRAEFETMKTELTEKLRTVFNRDFSAGYYMGRPSGDWTKSANSLATRRKETVGIISNFYRKVGVAEIRVQGAGFSVGDELLIQGPTTGNMPVAVASIQVESKSIESAAKGQTVAVKVPDRVRANDAVYRRFDSV